MKSDEMSDDLINGREEKRVRVCPHHEAEVQRRETLQASVADLKSLMLTNENRFVSMHNRINGIEAKVMGIFVSLGLILFIVLGAYTYTNIVDKRNDRGEEILLTKINADALFTRNKNEELMKQVVTLLTSNAENKEWQRGVITQLEMLNAHIRDITTLKSGNQAPSNSVPMYYTEPKKKEN